VAAADPAGDGVDREHGVPRVVVAGLGPAGAELLPEATRRLLAEASRSFLRTGRHPAVASLPAGYETFDALYEDSDDFDALYAAIVEALVAAALDSAHANGFVAYVVPGSPLVAERSVTLLRADGRVEVEIVPAPSFLDLAWDRLGVDPVEGAVRVVDAASFARDAAGDPGPLLVAQCHSRALLSEVKLAVEEPGDAEVTLLHHLGLPDELVRTVAWEELDRVLEPDHLTSLWIPALADPVARETVRLEELVRTLRARCPWDMRQTHASLGRHLLEEAYEALDAIEAFAAAEPDVPAPLVTHLEEELGDLLFQVVFHAVLAAEEGRFTLADVARGVHDKLHARHPHVFGDAVAETPEEVARRWEQLKKAEKGRTSVTEGIPSALPALALVAKLLRKAEAGSLEMPGPARRREELDVALTRLASAPADRSGETLDAGADEARAVGAALFALADLARRAGVDPETALRAEAQRFRSVLESNQ
jgi:tetrapyrrole methylase family protein/MazG family protein